MPALASIANSPVRSLNDSTTAPTLLRRLEDRFCESLWNVGKRYEDEPTTVPSMPRKIERAQYFGNHPCLVSSTQVSAIAGPTWTDAIFCSVELAKHVVLHMASRSTVADETAIWPLWKELVSVAWTAELVARTARCPQPFRAWQAAMIVAAAALEERLEGTVVSIENSRVTFVRFGSAMERQIETLISEAALTRQLRLPKPSPEGNMACPWSILALAVRINEVHSDSRWDNRFKAIAEAVELPPIAKLGIDKAVGAAIEEYRELAVLFWDSALRLVQQAQAERAPHLTR